MPSARQQRGTTAEDQAAQYLQTKGFVILERHVTSRYGELDVLAEDHGTIVAVEVKYRNTSTFGPAAESVTPQKLEKIELALDDILAKRGWETRPVRIDVVTIDGDTIRHLVGASQE